MGEVKNAKRNSFLRQCFVTGSVTINIVGHGCVIGYSAILIPSLRRAESHIQATTSQESWIASIVGIALIFGNILITPLMDIIGRKKSHLLTTIPILVGWFILVNANSVASLIIARFLQGVSMGMLGPLGSVIIGEMTDPKNRGAFLTCISLSLTIGVLFTHAMGTYISWQQTALICSFTAFTSMIMTIYAPESPPWLISKGRFEESKDVFFWLRGQDEEQEAELEDMISAQKLVRKSSLDGQKIPFFTRVKRFFRYFKETSRKPEFYKPIVIMFHIYIMFQFGGMNVLSSYTTDVIKNLVGPDVNAKLGMVALDIERLICNVLAVFLMRKLKRRTLLFSTGAICVITYIGQGFYIYAKRENILPFDSKWIPITLLALYMFSLSVGISAIPFTMSGEIFPLEYRGLGGGISVLALSLNFFVAVKCFPVLAATIGFDLTYYLYAGVVVYCLMVSWFMLPETKGRTLQEIEDGFRGLSTMDRKCAEPLNGKYDFMVRRCSSQIIY